MSRLDAVLDANVQIISSASSTRSALYCTAALYSGLHLRIHHCLQCLCEQVVCNCYASHAISSYLHSIICIGKGCRSRGPQLWAGVVPSPAADGPQCGKPLLRVWAFHGVSWEGGSERTPLHETEQKLQNRASRLWETMVKAYRRCVRTATGRWLISDCCG